jgi:AraC-like DNA-binding protein
MATDFQRTTADPFIAAATRCDFRFSTRSADEAVSAVEQLYGPHELALSSGRGLNLQFTGFGIGRLSVSGIAYGCPALGRPVRPNEYWMFSYIVRGEARTGGQKVDAGTACVRAPGTLTDIPMSADLRLVNLKVEAADLLAARATLLGHEPDEPLRFHERMAAGSPPAVRLASLLQRLHQLPSCAPPFGALLERRWQEATLVELLLALPHSSARLLDQRAAPSSAVDRALNLIHSDPSAGVTLGELARASGVGIRALTRGFERRLGVSPMRYLRQCRLERARRDLLDGSGTVTEVAYRWGFGNLGDFSRAYRERFGQRPSQTLTSAESPRR